MKYFESYTIETKVLFSSSNELVKFHPHQSIFWSSDTVKMKVTGVLFLFILLQGWTVGAQQAEGLEFGEFFFRIFPVSERPNINSRADKKSHVHFHLYKKKDTNLKRSTQEDGQEDERDYRIIDTRNLDEEVNSLNSSIPTMIIIHGFMENNKAKVIIDLLEATMESGRWNVIYVDWRTLSAGPWYSYALLNVRAAGRYVANFIDSMARSMDRVSAQKSNNISKESSSSSEFLKNLHVVGFSLGSHVAGVAGKHVTTGRIGRITGLDPALPLVKNLKSERLDKTCAEFVDVMHTSGGSFGMQEVLGHADFYPNGGTGVQPGCHNELISLGCSHWNAWRYFTESVKTSNLFESLPCTSWKAFESGDCDHFQNTLKEGPVYMGVDTSSTARGKYFLRTKPTPPYSMPL